jgi:hypothetical protein
MKTIDKDLAQREKIELIAIIKQMLQQQPELEWLLQTPVPTPSQRTKPVDPQIYRDQIAVILSLADNPRHRKYRDEIKRRLSAIKATADAFAEHGDSTAAVTIYEVLVTEVLRHYNAYFDEYITFSIILHGCIDGLDSCFAGDEENQDLRLRVLQSLFAIYRFSTDSGMDLDEDIPGLLIGNATPQERHIIAGWVREALSQPKGAGYGSEQYNVFLAALDQRDKK